MAPQYGLGGIDWSSYANDPYFWATLNSYNPNFRGAQSAAGGYDASTLAALQQAAQTGNVSTPSATTSGATVPSIDYATTQPESSGAGAWIAGTTGAAALVVGAAAIKHGSLSKGLKAIGKFFTGKASGEVSKAVDGATTKLTAIRGEDGVTRYIIPKKTVSYTGTVQEIEQKLNEVGMKNVATVERQAFKPNESVINQYTWNDYTITTENGVISKIEKDNKDLTSLFTTSNIKEKDKSLYERFENILRELGKGKNADKTTIRGVNNINYTNTFGDDVLEMTIAKYEEPPVINKFTTLGRYTIDSPEIKKLKLSEAERALFSEEFIAGKLCDNAQVGAWTKTMPDGTVLKFNGNKLESIVQGTEEYEEGSMGFIKYLEKKHGAFRKKTNQSVVDDYISAVFDKKEIPYDTPITIS